VAGGIHIYSPVPAGITGRWACVLPMPPISRIITDKKYETPFFITNIILVLSLIVNLQSFTSLPYPYRTFFSFANILIFPDSHTIQINYIDTLISGAADNL
jgi:hypothetical protein